MPVPVLDLHPQHDPLLPRFVEKFQQLVTQGQFVLGPEVEAFEQELAQACDGGAAVGMSSGTDALLAALMALEIGPGDEVITTPFTFFATAGTIARTGARPVFIDIDPVTFNLDPALIEPAVTTCTRAIMPVHLYGQMVDSDAVESVARKHSLTLIADAAQAIGARDGERPLGRFGDVVCLSFYPTKNLSAMGDAGACLTHDKALEERLRKVRLHGGGRQYHHEMIGGNFRLDAIQAAMLRIKLPMLDAWTTARREAAERYTVLLAGLPVTPPATGAGKFHVYHQYTLRVEGNKRDALVEHLRGRGIGCGVYYPLPLHLQPCFRYLGLAQGALPHAERASAEVLSLPIYPGLTEDAQAQVARAIAEFFE